MDLIISFAIYGLIGFAIYSHQRKRQAKKGKQEPTTKNKIAAHIVLVVADIGAVFWLWSGVNDTMGIIGSIHSYADIISFRSTIGGALVAVIMPMVHVVVTLSHLKPEFMKKNERKLNIGGGVALATLVFMAVMLTSTIKTSIVNAGYFYCHSKDGGIRHGRTLVYTRDMQICKERVEIEAQRSLSAR